jgi:Fe-S oxidoreductase
MLSAFSTFKAAFDPVGMMNPGRGPDPRRLDEDIRVYDLLPASPFPTHLELAGDGRDLAAAARRCVGVGRCRRLDGGSMCPSFQVTRDEEHSTRGRARLIGEMLGGGLAGRGWRSEEVRDALDLCLGCKACRVECPVGIDMATYRVEFLAHHYRHRIRPRAHYAFGFLPVALRIASRAPGLVNILLSRRSVGGWLRRVAGISPSATLPQIHRGARRENATQPPSVPKDAADRVVRFADCFTRFVEPEIARAADESLDRLGLGCDVVAGANCCGLTWYSTGQLGIARRVVERTIATLRRSGDRPIVVLEPSCAAMLRDDAPALLGAEIGDVTSRIVSLAQAIGPIDLAERTRTDDSVVAQIHCHAFAGAPYERELECISAMGGTLAAVETRCCGLAGNFGLEEGHEAISRAIATQNIVATLASVPEASVIMADGFSCRTQITAVTGRQARHFAEILRDALRREDVRDAEQGTSGRR